MNKHKIKDALRQAIKKDQPDPPGPEEAKKPKRAPYLIVIGLCLLIFGWQYFTNQVSTGPDTGQQADVAAAPVKVPPTETAAAEPVSIPEPTPAQSPPAVLPEETTEPQPAETDVVPEIVLKGEIILPVEGTITGHDVSVIIETKNLEPGTCVWLAVDKPDIGLCWPKTSLQANRKLQTTIYEGGPKEPYRLSLYAFNETWDKQWQSWLDHKIFGGLPMPPDSKRLAHVTLILGP